MRNVLRFAAAGLLLFVAASSLAAQLGVERRIDRRLDRRADAGNANAAARLNDRAATDPNAWRMQYNNNQWWYYTPKNQWMYYDNNNWTAYDAKTYLPPRTGYVYGNYAPNPRGRYYAGYRGYWGPPAVAPTAPVTTAAPTTAAPVAVQPAPAAAPAATPAPAA